MLLFFPGHEVDHDPLRDGHVELSFIPAEVERIAGDQRHVVKGGLGEALVGLLAQVVRVFQGQDGLDLRGVVDGRLPVTAAKVSQLVVGGQVFEDEPSLEVPEIPVQQRDGLRVLPVLVDCLSIAHRGLSAG